MFRAVLLAAIIGSPLFGASVVEQTNWSGPYRTCNNKSELLKFGHMDLGVRIETSNLVIAAEFLHALQFWSRVLDMSFHEDSTSDCALALVEGTATVLHQTNNVARAQFADLAGFEAWIAFDAHASEYMSKSEVYATAVHELGHLFGLRHNPRPTSIMYFLDCDGTSILDEDDLRSLGSHHGLREHLGRAIPVAAEIQ